MRRATGKSHSKIEQCTTALNTKADHPKSAAFLDQMLLLSSINDNALPVLDTSSFKAEGRILALWFMYTT